MPLSTWKTKVELGHAQRPTWAVLENLLGPASQLLFPLTLVRGCVNELSVPGKPPLQGWKAMVASLGQRGPASGGGQYKLWSQQNPGSNPAQSCGICVALGQSQAPSRSLELSGLPWGPQPALCRVITRTRWGCGSESPSTVPGQLEKGPPRENDTWWNASARCCLEPTYS